MADIIDPRVIKFCNESVRPMAEKMRELDALLGDMARKWDNEIADILTGNADEDPVIDGRSSEGISILNKNDLVLFNTQVDVYIAQMAKAGVRDTIQKPCVRHINVG